ncbi:MAG: Ltp family lipoprotein, partial [Blautia sp.]|nr:Ltp family lipoprotein [Blautia sp.]
ARAAASAGSDIPSAGAQEAPGIPAPDPQQDTGSTGEKSAIQSAREYLAISAFSKQGLIDQLVYEGFSESEAENAVGSISIDWKEQAYESAKEYLDIMNFTISDLTAQLVYDGFTSEEVTYGVDKAYHR